MERKTETIQIRYYNVLFYLTFKETDMFKKDVLESRIEAGESFRMKEIYEWSKGHHVPITSRFIYRKDFPLTANLWNLYSYIRFMIEKN